MILSGFIIAACNFDKKRRNYRFRKSCVSFAFKYIQCVYEALRRAPGFINTLYTMDTDFVTKMCTVVWGHQNILCPGCMMSKVYRE